MGKFKIVRYCDINNGEEVETIEAEDINKAIDYFKKFYGNSTIKYNYDYRYWDMNYYELRMLYGDEDFLIDYSTLDLAVDSALERLEEKRMEELEEAEEDEDEINYINKKYHLAALELDSLRNSSPMLLITQREYFKK